MLLLTRSTVGKVGGRGSSGIALALQHVGSVLPQLGKSHAELSLHEDGESHLDSRGECGYDFRRTCLERVTVVHVSNHYPVSTPAILGHFDRESKVNPSCRRFRGNAGDIHPADAI